jgi:hypothetical protein
MEILANLKPVTNYIDAKDASGIRFKIVLRKTTLMSNSKPCKMVDNLV